MDSVELSEWQAMERIDPWGQRRTDVHCGIIASAAANAPHTSMKRLTTAHDMIPKFERPMRKPAPDLAAKLKAWFRRK